MQVTTTPPPGSTTPPLDTTPPLAPTTPTNQLMLPEIVDANSMVLSSTSAMIAWQPVAGASGYNIYLYREGEQVGDPLKVTRLPLFDTCKYKRLFLCCSGYRECGEPAGLLPFTEYTVRVAAVQGDGSEGEQSSPFLFNTPEGCKHALGL